MSISFDIFHFSLSLSLSPPPPPPPFSLFVSLSLTHSLYPLIPIFSLSAGVAFCLLLPLLSQDLVMQTLQNMNCKQKFNIGIGVNIDRKITTLEKICIVKRTHLGVVSLSLLGRRIQRIHYN